MRDRVRPAFCESWWGGADGGSALRHEKSSNRRRSLNGDRSKACAATSSASAMTHLLAIRSIENDAATIPFRISTSIFCISDEINYYSQLVGISHRGHTASARICCSNAVACHGTLPRGWLLPALVMPPRLTLSPVDLSDGVRPRYYSRRRRCSAACQRGAQEGAYPFMPSPTFGVGSMRSTKTFATPRASTRRSAEVPVGAAFRPRIEIDPSAQMFSPTRSAQ
jgi:hypothetical protein